MNWIVNAVGPGKPNLRGDVLTLQKLLNARIGRLIPLRPLKEDGVFGPATARAIAAFQARVVKLERPDSVVEPDGPTMHALAGGAKIKAATGAPADYVTKFIAMALPAARKVKAKWGVPVSVVIAQSAQETGWGRNVKNNAYFGVKGATAGGKTARFGTTEVVGGKVVHIQANFRAYKDYEEAAEDYGKVLAENSRYSKCFEFKNDPVRFVQELARAGYATDPNYGGEIISIIQGNGLEKYDK